MVRITSVCVAALIAASGGAAAQTLAERGDYLVNAVMACDGCHTPRAKAGFVMERRFAGGSQVWETPAYTVRGTNITPDRETGIGAWTDVEIKRALTHGVSRDGRPFKQPMARQDYFSRMTDADLDAIVAWVRTIPPIE
ncbi:MAG: c-type cytochrome [Burkholderiales bacterium]